MVESEVISHFSVCSYSLGVKWLYASHLEVSVEFFLSPCPSTTCFILVGSCDG